MDYKKSDIKLDIGTGKTKLKNYITVDLYAPNADIQADCASIPFDVGAVQAIYTSHMIEHLSPEHFERALRHWYNLLQKQGILEIRCPNAMRYVQEWFAIVNRCDWNIMKEWGIRNMLGWADKGSGMLNRNLFTKDYLEWLIKQANFDIIECSIIETRVLRRSHVEYRSDGDIYLKAMK